MKYRGAVYRAFFYARIIRQTFQTSNITTSSHIRTSAYPHIRNPHIRTSSRIRIFAHQHIHIFFGRCLRPVLSAHTAQALSSRPVSAAITNAKLSEPEFVEFKKVQNKRAMKKITKFEKFRFLTIIRISAHFSPP
jgi:hypothetical protein